MPSLPSVPFLPEGITKLKFQVPSLASIHALEALPLCVVALSSGTGHSPHSKS
jgi:hypothetical protein